MKRNTSLTAHLIEFIIIFIGIFYFIFCCAWILRFSGDMYKKKLNFFSAPENEL